MLLLLLPVLSGVSVESGGCQVHRDKDFLDQPLDHCGISQCEGRHLRPCWERGHFLQPIPVGQLIPLACSAGSFDIVARATIPSGGGISQPKLPSVAKLRIRKF